MNYSNLIVI